MENQDELSGASSEKSLKKGSAAKKAVKKKSSSGKAAQRRGRGRPPGARNKPKSVEEQVEGGPARPVVANATERDFRGKGRASAREQMQWVADHLYIKGVKPGDCPDQETWTMYQYATQDVDKFMAAYLRLKGRQVDREVDKFGPGQDEEKELFAVFEKCAELSGDSILSAAERDVVGRDAEEAESRFMKMRHEEGSL